MSLVSDDGLTFKWNLQYTEKPLGFTNWLSGEPNNGEKLAATYNTDLQWINMLDNQGGFTFCVMCELDIEV